LKEFSPVEIAAAGRRALNADVYRPDPSQSLHAAVILLHGGAWRMGSRADVAPYARVLARRGFVAIAAEYRLLGEAPWPAQVDDVNDVVAWVRANATELGIHPGKIALEGFSAGAHLALLAAGTSARKADGEVAAVVSFFAPVDLAAPSPPGMPRLVDMLLGPAATAEQVRTASPIHQVARGFPPTFLLAGLADVLLPPAETLRMFDALLQAGVPADLHMYHAHTHEFAALPSMLEPVQEEVALFLRRSVVDPSGHAEENLKLNPFARPGGLPPMPTQEQ
jgi:acetyl esterase/lipase